MPVSACFAQHGEPESAEQADITLGRCRSSVLCQQACSQPNFAVYDIEIIWLLSCLDSLTFPFSAWPNSRHLRGQPKSINLQCAIGFAGIDTFGYR
jgi:hypothetical protein